MAGERRGAAQRGGEGGRRSHAQRCSAALCQGVDVADIGVRYCLLAKPRPADPPLPIVSSSHAASFLETRVHALLRQLEKMHRRPVKAAPARRPGSASPAPKRAPGSAHPAGKKGAGGPSPLTLEQAETLLGGETMTLVRKLRTLERKGAEMAASLVAMKTKKYLGDVGRRCEALVPW